MWRIMFRYINGFKNGHKKIKKKLTKQIQEANISLFLLAKMVCYLLLKKHIILYELFSLLFKI